MDNVVVTITALLVIEQRQLREKAPSSHLQCDKICQEILSIECYHPLEYIVEAVSKRSSSARIVQTKTATISQDGFSLFNIIDNRVEVRDTSKSVKSRVQILESLLPQKFWIVLCVFYR